MGAFQFNVAKGRSVHYASLPAANDAIIAVLLQSAGLEADAVLKDADTLAAVVAGTTNEATFGGYARRTIADVAVSVDDAADEGVVDFTDPVWSPTTSQALGKIVFCYDPDTTGGTDADIIPLWADDYALTSPLSGSISYVVDAAGIFRAA